MAATGSSLAPKGLINRGASLAAKGAFVLAALFCAQRCLWSTVINLSNVRKDGPMASENASVAKIALDLHAELGPPNQKRRNTVSRHEKRRDEARLVFNKIIASHYRAKANDYSQVGALFITWAVNDLQLHGKDSEVSHSFSSCNFYTDTSSTGEPTAFNIQ